MTIACITIGSPVGPLYLSAKNGKIGAIEFRRGPESLTEEEAGDLAVLLRAAGELERYFAGDLREFTVPVGLVGPIFHKKVWDVLLSIPFGHTMTYAQIAERLGSPKAARAVGNACARNPVVIIVPCHRVLAQNGLGGFGGGLPTKRLLLRHEGYALPSAY